MVVFAQNENIPLLLLVSKLKTLVMFCYRSLLNGLKNQSQQSTILIQIRRKLDMEASCKREHEDSAEAGVTEPQIKCMRSTITESGSVISTLKHGKNRPVPKGVLNRLTAEEIDLLENVKSSCTDLEKIKAAIQVRVKYRLSVRLPEDMEDSTYYIQDGLRRVYPYQYLYQTYSKRRWCGRKLRDVIKEEFRDLSEEQLKWRFEKERILVNGMPAKYDHVLRDNDNVANRVHRHELPVLATPIKIIHQDKDTLVVDKPPSVPIHPCGRYRHNSVVNILRTEYNFPEAKVVHRLDRLVSGVLIFALNTNRAHLLENAIKNRDVEKVYVCRVDGEFPLGDPADDGEITVDEPLETVPGKIGITVVLPHGKPSSTIFKRLNYNGKTSAVLCRPKTGRMHQIRVHLQYLGYPIVNDGLYNCTSFGPERGKGGKFGKTLQQLSADIIATHRASTWVMCEDSDVIDSIAPRQVTIKEEESKEPDTKTVQFISEAERQETMAALAHFFSNESWKDLEQKWKFNSEKLVKDPTCRDCHDKFHDPPPRRMFLYLHALKYSGSGWCYESEMPVWARDSWQY